MNEIAKRLVVAVVLFFLVAFGYVQLKAAAKAEAENQRLTIAAAAINDTVQIWRTRFAAADTVLQRQLATIDSLAGRTGPIRWRTRIDSVIVIETVFGNTLVDTIFVRDSMAVVEVDSVVHFIPTVVALELQECRVLIETCAEYKHNADSTIKWQATHIDTLQVQIDNLSKQFGLPHLGVFGLDLPLPEVTAGYGVMYSMNGCDGETTEFDGEILVVTKPQCDKIVHGFMLGLSWTVWSP